jgi:RNA recognition motif-containing protein
MNIHITNLDRNVIESDLRKLFTPFGEVGSVELVRDKLNNRSRGRAYVEMPLQPHGEKAISDLNRTWFKGKVIAVAAIGYNPGYDAWTFRALETTASEIGKNKNSLL